MRYSLCGDFLNAKKIVYPMAKYLSSYLLGMTNFSPWSVEIHPTAKCNHRCIHCSYKERNENRIELSQDMFEKLIDSLIGLKVHGIYFAGGGEPCMYPYLATAVKRLYENGIESALVSNGSLIEQTKIFDIANCFNYIALSVPSCTEERFCEITGQNFMERVLSLPQKIKNRFGNSAPIIGARVVVTSLIVEEVPHILQTLKDRSFDYAIFKIVRDYEDRGLGISDAMAANLQEVINQLSKSGRIDRKFTNLESVFDYRKPYDLHGGCHVNTMGLLAAVTPEGDVYPNIVEIGQEDFCIGNLYKNKFEDIWQSARHQAVKDISNVKWAAGKCKDCRAISYNLHIQNMVGNLPCEEDSFI